MYTCFFHTVRGLSANFVPVSFGATFPIFLVAHPSVPVKNVADLIALAKKQPGKISFGSAGNGGGTHLAGELFNAGAEAMPTTPGQFGQILRTEILKWGKVVKAANIQAD